MSCNAKVCVRVCVCVSDLHALYGVGQQAGSVDEVSVFHIFCDSLQETQRLVEDDGHRDLGQLLSKAHNMKFVF